MKYVTWNVNSVRIRIPPIRHFIDSEKPEVLMLQELKCTEEDFPFDAFPEYNCYIWGQKSYNGVAILVRKPIKVTDFEKVTLGDIDHSRCVKLKLNDITVISVYVPCGATVGPVYEIKKTYLEHLVEFLQNLPDEKVIIGGDFNVAITDEELEYPKRPEYHVFTMPAFRESMQKLLQSGFSDIIDPGQYSWWDYRAPSKGARIDYVLARGVSGKQFIRAQYRRMTMIQDMLDKKLRPVQVETKPSDHVPIIFQAQKDR